MKTEDWLVLDDMQSTLPGESIFCGDYNARGALWGNEITNPQGEALEDALDRCNLTCINNGSITREASRPGDSDSVIDLALTTLTVAADCRWQTLGKHSNDHYPCSVWIKRKKVHKQLKRKKVFKYEEQEDNLISEIRQKVASKPQGNKQTLLQQPPWFTDEIR